MPIVQKENQNTILLVIVIGFLSLVIRLWGLPSKGLWYDELQTVTHAILPLDMLLKSLQAYDPHPPFYYLQLHWWMSLSTTDLWIKLNSVFWSVSTTILLFIASKKIFNIEIAIIASVLFSIAPFAVVQSQNARMYSLLMFFGLLSFILTHQFLYATRVLLPGIGMIISTVIFLYSHGAGFMLLVSLFSYATISLLGNKTQKWKRFVQWCLMQLVILLLYLPWLIRAHSINLGHLVVPDLKTIVNTLYMLFYGFSIQGNPEWLQWSLVLLTIIAIGIALTTKNAGGIIVAFIIVPVLFSIVVSYLYRPIWIHRTLAYTMPFLSLAVALAISKLRTSRNRKTNLLGKAYSLALVFSLLIALVYQQFTFRYQGDFKQAVEYAQSEVQAGDIVHIPHERVYWGWLWYFSGPGSVNPLNSDYSTVTAEGIHLLAGSTIDNRVLEGKQHYWLVHRDVDNISPPESYLPETTREFNHLFVEHLRRSVPSTGD